MDETINNQEAPAGDTPPMTETAVKSAGQVRGRRVEKIGIVTSDKMMKTVVMVLFVCLENVEQLAILENLAEKVRIVSQDYAMKLNVPLNAINRLIARLNFLVLILVQM